MERLTYTDKPVLKPWVRSTEAINRLAAYEDTWLEPAEYKKHVDAIRKLDIQHIHDLLVAEADGRLLVLPCKVGDTVYQTDTDSVRIYESKIKRILFDADNITFDERAIGSSVFLTREEAEAKGEK